MSTPSASPSPLSIRVAAVQMVSKPDVAANLRDASALIGEAASRGARLVGLPEYFCLMGSDTDKVAVREPDGHGPIQDFLAETAARHRIWLVGGTVPLAAPQPDKVMNSVLVYGPDGGRVARYDKVHLFAFATGDESYDEAKTIAPGRAVRSFELAPADAKVVGQVVFEVGDEEPLIDLVGAVQRHQRRVEGMPGADYKGGQELVTPLGSAFYSRGRYLTGADLVEETELVTKHPSSNRILAISYRYPAAGDSSVRVQQLLEIVSVVQSLGGSAPAAAG
jgi:hypothetical protein